MLPSHQETAPMVVQQAMAAGLAVVATNVGGIPQQVQHDTTGLLFGPGDVHALAANLRRLHDEPGLASRLGAAGRVVASERYRADEVAMATRAVYVQALAARGRINKERYQL